MSTKPKRVMLAIPKYTSRNTSTADHINLWTDADRSGTLVVFRGRPMREWDTDENSPMSRLWAALTDEQTRRLLAKEIIYITERDVNFGLLVSTWRTAG